MRKIIPMWLILICMTIAMYNNKVKYDNLKAKHEYYMNCYLDESDYSESLVLDINYISQELEYYRSEYLLLTGDFDPREIAFQVAKTHDVDPNLIYSIMRVESRKDYKAISPRGAKGLMQLMPIIQNKFGVVNPWHPVDNVTGGVKYIKYLISYYEGDIDLILAAYNAGETNVEKYNGVPPFKETRNYIKRVRKYYGSDKFLEYDKIDNRTSGIIVTEEYIKKYSDLKSEKI
jgi:membrane-bound lytic murein transglycosylase MltF